MHAALVGELGSPPRAGELEAPAQGEGQALVEVAAAPLNPIEIRVASGSFARRAQPPYVPGLEGAGRVVESERLLKGTRVRFEPAALPGFGSHGTLAELAAVEEESLVELPDAVDDAHAAALGVVGITAALALDRAGLQGGERVLVLGAPWGRRRCSSRGHVARVSWWRPAAVRWAFGGPASSAPTPPCSSTATISRTSSRRPPAVTSTWWWTRSGVSPPWPR